MKFYKIIVFVILISAFASCFSSETPNKNAVENPPINQPVNTTQPINEKPKAEEPEAVNRQPETEIIPKTEDIRSFSSPTETFKTYTVATLNKDIQAIKDSLSNASLRFVEEAARKQNVTVEEMLTGGAVQMTERKIPETQNEKIEGINATIEVKNDMTGNYDKLPFVKENGKWKLALDKLQEQTRKKLQDIKKRLQDPNAE